jgi:hypothetical protein
MWAMIEKLRVRAVDMAVGKAGGRGGWKPRKEAESTEKERGIRAAGRVPGNPAVRIVGIDAGFGTTGIAGAAGFR